MKVSKEKRAETRRTLVRTAAELFVNQGFDATTMKQIARAAGIGDATVYKYFPNKDKLVLGFYEVCADDALQKYRNIDGLDTYTFPEKLQLLFDTFLEELIADREFVQISVSQLLKSPISLFRDQFKPALAYKAEFTELLEQLAENDAYPAIPMQSLVAGLLTDYLLIVAFYWLKDDSEEFAHTTQFCDLSVSMIDSVLKSGLINQAMDILSFFIKTHLLRGLSSSGNMLKLFQEFKGAMDIASK